MSGEPERISAATGLPDPLNLALFDMDNPLPEVGTPIQAPGGAYVAGTCGHRVPLDWWELGKIKCTLCAWAETDKESG